MTQNGKVKFKKTMARADRVFMASSFSSLYFEFNMNGEFGSMYMIIFQCWLLPIGF